MISSDYLTRWRLVPDGDLVVTHNSQLLPVRQDGAPAMLKVTAQVKERSGAALMTWWDGDGAARVLARDGGVLLLERAEGSGSLADLVRRGRDDEASRIICRAVARLHARTHQPPPDLVPLATWFAPLDRAAGEQGGMFKLGATTARELLAVPHDVVVLHGDIHHGNILDFGGRGWLAVDPKGLRGERGFDYANIFCNPDDATATAPGRLPRQVRIVAEAARLERTRLLQWVVAWASLSAVWLLEDGLSAETSLAVAALAAAELNR